jgi:hypothetical protein
MAEQRMINAVYSKILKDRVKLDLRSKQRSQSVKIICLLHDKACPHTAAVTTGTCEEMHWEILQHPTCSPDLAPGEIHLSEPPKEVLRRKRFRADDEVKILDWLDEQPQNLFGRDIMKLPERWRGCIGVQGEQVEK